MHVGLELFKETLYVLSFWVKFPMILEYFQQMLTPWALFGRPWASFDRLQAPFQLGVETRRAVRGALGTILANSVPVWVTPKVTFSDSFWHLFGLGFREGSGDQFLYDFCMFLALVFGVFFGILCCWL